MSLPGDQTNDLSISPSRCTRLSEALTFSASEASRIWQTHTVAGTGYLKRHAVRDFITKHNNSGRLPYKMELCGVSTTLYVGSFSTKLPFTIIKQSSPKEVQVIDDTMPRCLQLLCLCNHRFTAKPVCLWMTNSVFIKRKKTQECWGMLKRGFQLEWNKR